MGIRWQYLAEGDRYRWYRLVSRENLESIDSELTELEEMNAAVRRGVPLLAPWRILGALVERHKLRAALRTHIAKVERFHQDMLANTDYPRLASDEQSTDYSDYPEYANWQRTRKQVEGVLAGKRRKPKTP